MLGGSGSWNLQEGRKKDGRLVIKNWWHSFGKQKDIPEKPRGVDVTPTCGFPGISLFTSEARSAERVYFYNMGEKWVWAAAGRGHALWTLIPLERDDQFTNGHLNTMSPWVENAVWQVWPLPHQLCPCHTNILSFYHYWPHQLWLAGYSYYVLATTTLETSLRPWMSPSNQPCIWPVPIPAGAATARGTCRGEGVGDTLSIGNSTTAGPIAFKFGVCLETS